MKYTPRGGSVTVRTAMGLFRIAPQDLDALGAQVVEIGELHHETSSAALRAHTLYAHACVEQVAKPLAHAGGHLVGGGRPALDDEEDDGDGRGAEGEEIGEDRVRADGRVEIRRAVAAADTVLNPSA